MTSTSSDEIVFLRLLRCYEALWPASPASLKLPSGGYLLESAQQTRLIDLAVTTKLDAAAPWRRAFWKSILGSMESAIHEPEEQEIDGALYESFSELMTTPDTSLLRKTFIYGPLDNPTDCVRLIEQRAAVSQGSTGLATWGAAVRLSNHLLCNPEIVAKKNCLEIGSGNGLLACLVGQIQRRTGSAGQYTATELPQVLPLLQSNISLSAANSFADVICHDRPLTLLNVDDLSECVHTAELDWTEIEDPAVQEYLRAFQPEVVLGSDIIYDKADAPPLVQCLALALLKPASYALISVTVRQPETFAAFSAECHAQGLSVEELQLQEPSEDEGLVGGTSPAELIVKLLRVRSTERVVRT